MQAQRSDIKLTNDITRLIDASLSVILVRSREPMEACTVLRRMAMARSSKPDFRDWTWTHGWSTYDRNEPDKNPTTDNVVQPIAALQKIVGEGNSDAQDAFPKNGIYVMLWPHFVMNADDPNPTVMTILANFAVQFPESRRRLVLLVPYSYDIPEVLRELVTIIDHDMPTQEELAEVYAGIVSMDDEEQINEAEFVNWSPAEVAVLTSAGAGMTRLEFENAVAQCITSYVRKPEDQTVENFAALIMEAKTQIIKRTNTLSMLPAESMDNVGGVELLKGWVKKRKRAMHPAARDYGVDMPRGTLLIGPPGTGKSLSAANIGSTLGIPVVKLDIGRLMGGIVGQSEANTRDAMAIVDAMAPCVCFIDEIDKGIDRRSSHGDSGASKRVLGTLLNHMSSNNKAVVYAVSANRVDGLPPELLRKGRLDEIFFIDLPGEKARMEIFDIHLGKRGFEVGKIKGMDKVVQSSAGFSGAEIEQCVKDCILDAFDSVASKLDDDDEEGIYDLNVPYPSSKQFTAWLKDAVPLSEAFKDQWAEMTKWASTNAKKATAEKSPSPSASSGAKTSRARPQKSNDDLDG